MPVRVFVKLNIETGKISEVIDKISQMDEVLEAYPITGDFDAIVCLELANVSDMDRIIADRIQKIDGVKKTTTHVAFR